MKLSDIEDADLLATKVQLDQLENKVMAGLGAVDAKIITLDGKLNGLDARSERLSAKIDKVGRTIWLPAVAAIAQLLLLLFHKHLGTVAYRPSLNTCTSATY